MESSLIQLNKHLSILFLSFIMMDVALGQQILSIDQVISQTSENNPQIKVSMQSLEFSRGSFRVARSPFNTNVRLTGQSRRDQYTTSLDEPITTTDTRSWTYTLAASKKIGFGTIITPAFGVYSNGFESDGINTNKGTAFLNVEQPILRGLGGKYTRAQLNIAELSMSSQEHQYFYDASQYLLNALNAYVEFISAKQNLQIQLETEESMSETVRKMSRLVELDAIPGSELVVSEANLANQKTSTALAENRLALSKNSLATTIGINVEQLSALGDAPNTFPMNMSAVQIDDAYVNKWFEASMQLRQDYLAVINALDASVIGLDFSKREKLPRLNLNLGAGYNGIYQSEAFDQYFQPAFANYPGMNYSIGLTFNIAPRYDYEQGQRIQALANNEAATARMDYLKIQIRKEIQRDCDQLKYLLGAVQAVNDAVDFSKQALENEQKKLELGVSTAFNVALMQNNYLNALERQNALLQQLNVAILNFKHHTGTLLTASDNTTYTVNSNELFVLPSAP